MSKVTKVWTKGVPADVATKARGTLADKGIGTETLATLAADEITLATASEAAKRVKESQRLVWQFVALAFDGALPTNGAGSKEAQTVRAELLAAMGGDTPATRKRLGTYRWAGILALFAPERGDATLYALAEQADKARAIVTGKEAMPETTRRKPRTSGDSGSGKGSKGPDAPKSPKAVTPRALAGALVAMPKSTTEAERVRLDERAVAWLVQSRPEWLPAEVLAGLDASWAERMAEQDGAKAASGE